MNSWMGKNMNQLIQLGGLFDLFIPWVPHDSFICSSITFAILTALPKQPSSCVCHLLQVWHYLGSREESPALHHIHQLEMLLCMCILLLQPWKYQNPNTNACKYIHIYIYVNIQLQRDINTIADNLGKFGKTSTEGLTYAFKSRAIQDTMINIWRGKTPLNNDQHMEK